jgi:hypothetical protein
MMGNLPLEQRYKIKTYQTFGKEIVEIADYIGRDKSVKSKVILMVEVKLIMLICS